MTTINLMHLATPFLEYLLIDSMLCKIYEPHISIITRLYPSLHPPKHLVTSYVVTFDSLEKTVLANQKPKPILYFGWVITTLYSHNKHPQLYLEVSILVCLFVSHLKMSRSENSCSYNYSILTSVSSMKRFGLRKTFNC